MKVHVFGAASSPGCENYALRHAADEGRSQYGNVTADSLLENFYVDNLIKSMGSLSFAKDLIHKLSKICEDGGFNLTKFFARDPAALWCLPSEKRSSTAKQLEGNKEINIERALGIYWCIENDCLGFRISLQDGPITCRNILATISSIFDPLGVAGPFVLQGKRLLQEIVSAKRGWDDPIPPDQEKAWRVWRQSLTPSTLIDATRRQMTKFIRNHCIHILMLPSRVMAQFPIFGK